MVTLLRTTLLTVGIAVLLPVTLQAADADTRERLDRIERLLQGQGLLDMLQQIESLQREIGILRGEVELQTHTLEQLNKRQRDLYTDIDQRLQKLERAGDTAAAAGPELNFVDTDAESAPALETIAPIASDISANSGTQQAEETLMVEVLGNDAGTAARPPLPQQQPPATVATMDSDTPETGLIAPEPAIELDPVQIRAQYQQAFKLLKQSQYEQAIKALRHFLQINPRSEFSDNAQYWLAEAYYVTRQFEAALVEYNSLITNFPESQKLTHSLLKIGFCYYELGQMDEALSRLQELRQQYPDTTAARLADEKLKLIAQQQQIRTPATAQGQ